MSNAQSQWDFGETFPEEPTREVLTVSDLTTRVKRELENRIGQIWVEGEITNLMGSDAQRIADLTPLTRACGAGGALGSFGVTMNIALPPLYAALLSEAVRAL